MAELHAAATPFRDRLESSPAIGWLKDPEGRYSYINEPYAEQLRAPAEHVLGHTDAELEPREGIDGPRIREGAAIEGEPARFEYRVSAFEGRPALAVMRFPIEDPNGEIVAICGVAAPLSDAHLARAECAELMALDPSGAASPDDELEHERRRVAALHEASATAARRAHELLAALTAERETSEQLRRELAGARTRLTELEHAAPVDAAFGEELACASHRAQVAEGETDQALRRAAAAEAETEQALRRAEDAERHAEHERQRADKAEAAAKREWHRAGQAEGLVEHERQRAGAAEALSERERDRADEAERLMHERAQRAAQVVQAADEQRCRAEASDSEAERQRQRAEAAEARLADETERAEQAESAATAAIQRADRLRGELDAATASTAELAARAAAAELAAEPSEPPIAAVPAPVSVDDGPRWSAAAQRTLAATLANASEWRIGIRDVVKVLGREAGWDVVAAWLPDERGRQLRCAAMWSDDGDDLDEFETRTWQTPYPISTGELARAFAARDVTWLSGIGAASDDRLRVATSEGMTSAVLVPVHSGRAGIGLLELLSRHELGPDPELAAAMDAVALQLGHFSHLLQLGAQPHWRLGRL